MNHKMNLISSLHNEFNYNVTTMNTLNNNLNYLNKTIIDMGLDNTELIELIQTLLNIQEKYSEIQNKIYSKLLI